MSFYISPSSTTQTFPTATTSADGNLSTTTTGIDSAGAKDDDTGDKIVLFIIVATIPTVVLLILIAVVLARRVRDKGTREPFFQVQVEYNDKPRRPRSSNSRLDLTINGMQIDVEYECSPSSDKRISRLSNTSFVADPEQVRELHKLSQECKENLVRIHEMLEREFDPDVYDELDTETPSLSQDSELECANTRESVCSTYSADEKGSNEPSEKELKRSTSSAKESQDNEAESRDLSRECRLGNDFGDFIDSVFNSNDESEVENQPEKSTQRPTIPPKPSMKIQKDTSGDCRKPKPIPRVKNKTENQQKSPKNNKNDQHLSIKKPPVPKKRITLLRQSSKNDEKPTIARRKPEVAKKSAVNDNCSCSDKKAKPPIPKKPEGLVIKITKRMPKGDEVSYKRPSALKAKRTSKNVPCEDV